MWYGFGWMFGVFCLAVSVQADEAPPVVFAERGGIVAVEAEHFTKQTLTKVRAFHRTTKTDVPTITPDGDPSHVAGASGGAYLEILPDTRRTHGDKLIKNQNFAPQPGKMAVLHYRVNFETPERYYVWVRAFSTGSEDNGLHVGINGDWPESGQRLQWCAGKNSWRWDSKQRTQEEHCGEPHKIFLDIKSPGEHEIQFSMREDGFEFDKWLMTTDREFARPEGVGPQPVAYQGKLPESFPFVKAEPQQQGLFPEVPQNRRPQPRLPDGKGKVTVGGELKQWHNITLTLDGPFAHERDSQPNPFTDYRMEVEFQHETGKTYTVPGYFAADGNAKDTSFDFGTQWRAHLAPDLTGEWKYRVMFHRGPMAALDDSAKSEAWKPYHGQTGSFTVGKTDKARPDLRAEGRLQYVGKRYLQFAGSKRYFLKIGADAPETLLAYIDFDDTIAGNPKKAPLKSWSPHVKDWKPGDPTWKKDKGKGLIGAVNYLSGKGCNAFSFLTYNAGGDGDNVWPFISRNEKLHYDCSKLDQWAVVFEHGTNKGMYLHFKLQETEMDDNNRGKRGRGEVPESLDGGDLGPERKLYCREMIARFGHNLALNWNLGEENTQSTAQQQAMINYIAKLDPYHHNIVIHTFPEQQDKVYRPLLGDKSQLTGVSLQNSNIKDTHIQAVKWATASTNAGKPWIVAFDESGSAAHGQCPDLGYKGFDGRDRTGKMIYTSNEVRKQTLWGTLMAGGAGCEYYFGYQFVENDIVCEDWRSRDRSWDDGRIAIQFFQDHEIPFWEMANHDELVGNPNHGNDIYCLAKPNDTYLVYLPSGGEREIDLTATTRNYTAQWFNPRTGGELKTGSLKTIGGGKKTSLGKPPTEANQDWLVILR